MIFGSDVDWTNVNWDAVIQQAGIVQPFVPESGNYADFPEWFIELRKEALSKPQDLVTFKRTPKYRAKNCKSWIKNNLYTGGVRKRTPEARPPATMNNRPATLAQYQRHSAHLMSRVLNVRTNASPFTLVLDDLNQRAEPFLLELVRRAVSRNVNVVMVTFKPAAFHPAIRTIHAHSMTGDQIMQDLRKAMKDTKESLVIVSLNELMDDKGVDMGALFNLVAMKFASTLVGVYNQDVLATQVPQDSYAPQPLDLVKYLATSVIICKSFAHVLAAKAAKERSLAEPTYGMLQEVEGVVQDLEANDTRGIVLEAEFRRKSGRPESETYFLRSGRATDYNEPVPGMALGTLKQEFVVLLDQVPAYNSQEVIGTINAGSDEMESTFNLGLTEKQKQAREGVVLPYFDAQKGEGGEGGRILYDMGAEDDFDEEEDEI